ncbi:hypothetical protein V8G54_008735, partial [Vigna mungo]
PLAAILLTTICARFPRPHSNIVTQWERLLQRQIRLILPLGYTISAENTSVQLGSQPSIYPYPSLLNAFNARNNRNNRLLFIAIKVISEVFLQKTFLPHPMHVNITYQTTSFDMRKPLINTQFT